MLLKEWKDGGTRDRAEDGDKREGTYPSLGCSSSSSSSSPRRVVSSCPSGTESEPELEDIVIGALGFDTR